MFRAVTGTLILQHTIVDTYYFLNQKELEYEGRRYKTDKDGCILPVQIKKNAHHNEDSFDASNIYPSRVGEVTAVTTEDGKDDDGNPVTFTTLSIRQFPLILTTVIAVFQMKKATIIFQTGVLTGREFDIVQTDKDLTGYDHATRTFELVSLEEDGVTLPNENLKPAIGDKYAVFNIKLPQATYKMMQPRRARHGKCLKKQ